MLVDSLILQYSVNIWNLLRLFSRLIIWAYPKNIYKSTFPNRSLQNAETCQHSITAYLLSCNHLTIFQFLGNVLGFLSWNVHFKWSEQEFIHVNVLVSSGKGLWGRAAPPDPRIYRVPPKDTPRIHRVPRETALIVINRPRSLTGFSGTIEKKKRRAEFMFRTATTGRWFPNEGRY